MKNLTNILLLLIPFSVALFSQGPIDYKGMFNEESSNDDWANSIFANLISKNDTLNFNSIDLAWLFEYEPVIYNENSELILKLQAQNNKYFKAEFETKKSQAISKLDSVNKISIKYIKAFKINEYRLQKMLYNKINTDSLFFYIGEIEGNRIKLIDINTNIKTEYDSISKLELALDSIGRLKIKNSFSEFNSKIHALTNAQKNIILDLEKLFETIKSKSEKKLKSNTPKSAFAAMPEIMTSQKITTPSIAIQGLAKFGHTWIHEAQYFTGNSSASDTMNYFSLARPESSNYGLSIKGYKTFGNQKDTLNEIGLSYSVNYLNKQLVDSNLPITNIESLNIIHGKFGVEYAFFKETISVYGNYNFISPLNLKERFKNNFNLQNANTSHFDVGLKIFMSPLSSPDKSGTKFIVNLNFMEIPKITNLENENRNIVEPSVKVSLAKSF